MSELIPPSVRSHAALGFTAAAAVGKLALQVCEACGALQYPARETCVSCLSDQLTWREHNGAGALIAATTVHHSNHPYFQQRAPWNIGLVRLAGDVTVVAHLHHQCLKSRDTVRIRALLDRGGRAALVAFPIDATQAAVADPQVLEMTCSPKHKQILVTDGTSELGQALIESLLAAGAEVIWSGSPPQSRASNSRSNIRPVSLDLTRAESVAAAAAQLGAQVDIVINNAEIHGDPTASPANDVELAQAQMDTNYLGLVRLANALTPQLLQRAKHKNTRPCAWVNVLSIYALANLSAHGSFCASKAAALSFAQCLRAQLRTSGVRVLNIFPGPLDEPAFDDLPQPKLRPAALAHAITAALESGQEDCYPGPVAQDFLRRWRADPKVLELELQP
ncbi:MAG: SDR family NAD(P)-dependent oxidoreductase [Pseudomonadota bacterium]|nr:SDR family NAD(P)-dependent oxidoreductase [Pseudomonadota bacterium]